jgi:OmpA-OmpF porin, OOP family
MKLRNALLASATMAMPLAAHAQVTGPYVSLGAGVNIMQAEPFTFSTVTVNGRTFDNGNLKTTIGAAGVMAGGWGFGNGLRAELEADYRFNGFNNLAVSGTNGSIGLSGSEQKYGPMVNLLYDFPVGLSFMPYIGAGIGYQWAHESANSASVNGNTIFAGSTSHTNGSFAYQAILGAAFPIPSVAGLSLTGEYRFMGMSESRKYGSLTAGNDFNHSILVGLRYEFGVYH